MTFKIKDIQTFAVLTEPETQVVIGGLISSIPDITLRPEPETSAVPVPVSSSGGRSSVSFSINADGSTDRSTVGYQYRNYNQDLSRY